MDFLTLHEIYVLWLDKNEDSWACYCYGEAIVNYKYIDSCYGDCFSVNWMKNADLKINKNETLQD